MHPNLEPGGLYHLATVAEWETYQRTGAIEPPSLATEGFVHCSWGRQVAGTVAKHFAGTTDLLALAIDPQSLVGVGLVEEDSYGSGESFPHVYAPIPIGVVTDVLGLEAPGGA